MYDADKEGSDLQLARIMTVTRRGNNRDAMSIWELMDLDSVYNCVLEMPLLTFVALVYCICRR
jgi:hypothetical protein